MMNARKQSFYEVRRPWFYVLLKQIQPYSTIPRTDITKLSLFLPPQTHHRTTTTDGMLVGVDVYALLCRVLGDAYCDSVGA